MLIQTVFSDKKIGLVPHRDIDQMIENGSIAAFRRMDSWAIIGKDPIRNGWQHYSGEERRGKCE